MANRNVTLQARSCKENASTTQQKSHKPRQLTVLKAVRESKYKSHLHYRDVQLEPYVLLRGRWLTKAGFDIGQKITVHTSHQQLIITPSEAPPTSL